MPTTTLTFGEVAENGPGMQKLGQRAAKGLSPEILMEAKRRFEAAGCRCELVDLVAAAGVEGLEPRPEPAYLLVVHSGMAALGREAPPKDETPSKDEAPPIDEAPPSGGEPLASGETVDSMISGMASDDPSFVADLLSALESYSGGKEEKMDAEAISRRYADMLLQEQSALTPDKMAVFKGVVKNKRARWNLTFGDTAQAPNYAEKKGTIVPFSSLPLLSTVRNNLEYFFGNQAAGLRCEGNYYYDKSCGIGFHGDGERRIVIAVRLGDTIPLVYQWYLRFKPQGRRVDFALKHGTVYAMSGKAVGTDWMSSSFPTLRHAAGSAKYITPSKNSS